MNGGACAEMRDEKKVGETPLSISHAHLCTYLMV